MTIASLITAPRFGMVDAEFRPDTHDVGFCNVGKGCFYAGVVERSRLRGSSHCFNKFRATVWINGVIATMVGNVYAVEIVAFGNACCDGEHDAVAERHNRRLHILLFVMPFGNFVRPLQERTLEVLLHKLQGNNNVAYAQALAMQRCKRQFAARMVLSIVERDSQGNGFSLVVQERNGVEPTANDDYVCLSVQNYKKDCV